MLEEHPAEGATGPPKMKGSAMVVVAESEKEVKEIIEADIYAKSGVWDAEKAQIWPVSVIFGLRSGLVGGNADDGTVPHGC